MLRRIFAQTLIPRRCLHQQSVLLASNKSDNDPFQYMPQFGNSNTNPTLHQKKLKDKSAKRNGKVLSVAMLGLANSGKSTLTNKLMGKEVCPHSCKLNTTRKRWRAILTEGDTQIVFQDTPGVVTPEEATRFNMEKSVTNDPENSCRDADLLIVVHDLSNRYVREAINQRILRLLCKYQHRVPSILVLNKLDTLPKKRRIFDLIHKLTCNRICGGEMDVVKVSSKTPKWDFKNLKRRAKHESERDEKLTYHKIFKESNKGPVTEERAEVLIRGLTGWPGFSEVFCVSALDGDGVDNLRSFILKLAKPGGHKFSEDLVQDQDPREAVVSIVKSKLLENVDREVPYKLNPVIEYWKYDEDKRILHISVSIKTTNNRETTYLLGYHGETVRTIAQQVEVALEDFFDTQVKFHLQAFAPKQKEKPSGLSPVRLEEENSIFLS